MSRFIDPRATREVDLGPCECPGGTHGKDTATIRSELSGSEIAVLQATPRHDEEAASRSVAPLITAWTLAGPDGKPWPPSPEALRLLNAPTLTLITTAISEVVDQSSTLPNGSGAPSRASSRGSASRTRKTTTQAGT